MPYTPESPEQTTATSLPVRAASTAARQRSTSRRIPVERTSFSGKSFFTSSIYAV